MEQNKQMQLEEGYEDAKKHEIIITNLDEIIEQKKIIIEGVDTLINIVKKKLPHLTKEKEFQLKQWEDEQKRKQIEEERKKQEEQKDEEEEERREEELTKQGEIEEKKKPQEIKEPLLKSKLQPTEQPTIEPQKYKEEPLPKSKEEESLFKPIFIAEPQKPKEQPEIAKYLFSPDIGVEPPLALSKGVEDILKAIPSSTTKKYIPTGTVLRTIADDLLELVKKNKKISVEEAAKNLKMPLTTIQSLVDFLVEEKVFGIEYKFTTPYIYLYQEDIKALKGKDKSFIKGLLTKEQFYEKAKEKKIPYEHIEGLWRRYLQQNLVHIREDFFKKSREKKISEEKIEQLWKKYLTYL